MLLVRDIAMPLNFTGDAAPQRMAWRTSASFPSTRMGLAAQLRQAFLDAQDYQPKVADYDKKKRKAREKWTDKQEPASPPSAT